MKTTLLIALAMSLLSVAPTFAQEKPADKARAEESVKRGDEQKRADENRPENDAKKSEENRKKTDAAMTGEKSETDGKSAIRAQKGANMSTVDTRTAKEWIKQSEKLANGLLTPTDILADETLAETRPDLAKDIADLNSSLLGLAQSKPTMKGKIMRLLRGVKSLISFRKPGEPGISIADVHRLAIGYGDGKPMDNFTDIINGAANKRSRGGFGERAALRESAIEFVIKRKYNGDLSKRKLAEELVDQLIEGRCLA